MTLQKITNCYDSHTHFWATGQVALGLHLNQLKKAEDILQLNILPSHQKKNWIIGFGWNHLTWPAQQLPNKNILDQLSSTQPIFFSRVDGHASWLNTRAIQILKEQGYQFDTDPVGGRIERDTHGELTGILFDQAHILALAMLPDFSDSQNESFLFKAQDIFNQAGFTHVRDMSMNSYLWNLLRQIEDQKNLTLCLETFVTLESLNQLDTVLNDVKKMQSDSSKQMRVTGVKIFIDGSLGSQTAYLSQNYVHTNKNGLLIWSHEEIKEVIQQSWRAGQQVAVHAIGDHAVMTAVKAAREVSASGILGRLHLEHVQIVSHEVVQMMKPLHVTCYMQPCHWLSDSPWLKQVLTPELVKNLFQWELLRKNKIPFYFGSDSPIESPSVFSNIKALNESVQWGVPQLQSDWKSYHQHPDQNWFTSYTEFDEHKIRQVFFNGQKII